MRRARLHVIPAGSHLWQFDDPIGPLNDARIDYEASRADLMIAAWGAFTMPTERARAVEVLEIMQRYGTVYRLGSPRTLRPRPPQAPALSSS